MGQNIHSMLPKQNFDKSIMSSRCPSIFCPYFWPIAWRAPQRIGGSILRRMSQNYTGSINQELTVHHLLTPNPPLLASQSPLGGLIWRVVCRVVGQQWGGQGGKVAVISTLQGDTLPTFGHYGRVYFKSEFLE